MSLKERYYLWFKKDRVVKIILFHQDRRQSVHYVLPDNVSVTIGQKKYVIMDEAMHLSGGIPCFVYNADDPTPMQPLNHTPSNMSALDFRMYAEEEVSKHIIEGFEGGFTVKQMIAVVGVALGLVMFVAIYLQQQATAELMQRINELQDLIEFIGG